MGGREEGEEGGESGERGGEHAGGTGTGELYRAAGWGRKTTHALGPGVECRLDDRMLVPALGLAAGRILHGKRADKGKGHDRRGKERKREEGGQRQKRADTAKI